MLGRSRSALHVGLDADHPQRRDDRGAVPILAEALDHGVVMLAVGAVQERLRPRADDRRDPIGRVPVSVVPPDPIARDDLPLPSSDVGVVAVDEEEPVVLAAAARAARETVDRIDEIASVGGVDVGVLVEEADDRVGLGRIVERDVDHRDGAEIAGHAQVRLPARGLAGAESATTHRDGARQGREHRHDEDG